MDRWMDRWMDGWIEAEMFALFIAFADEIPSLEV